MLPPRGAWVIEAVVHHARVRVPMARHDRRTVLGPTVAEQNVFTVDFTSASNAQDICQA